MLDSGEDNTLPKHDLSHLTPIPEDAEDLLDVVVQVSQGSWIVRGQILQWRYDVPRDGDLERELSIKVWRRGGIINAQAKDEGLASWAERLCRRLCCIM